MKCYIFRCDLSKQNAANEIFEQVQILNLEMNILVSNAGIGYYGIFGEMPIDRQKDMMIINTYNPWFLHTLSTTLYIQDQLLVIKHFQALLFIMQAKILIFRNFKRHI